MRAVARRLLVAGVILSAVVGAGVAWVYFASEIRLAREYPAPLQSLELPSDAASIERGRHLAVHVALCTWCHGDDLGGSETADDPWVGRLHATNLTAGAGGVGRSYDDGDFARAIRSGVTPEGRSLLLMPSHYFHALSDADTASIIAWLRTMPPVDSEWPETWPGPLTRLALVAGLAPELIPAERIAQRTEPGLGRGAGPDREHLGAYLVDLASCRVCHHPDLSGGLHPLALPGEPPPPDLRASGTLSSWSASEFARAMRTGVTPDGRQLSHEYMPWPRFAGMTKEELDAIWAYLSARGPS